MGNSYTSKTLSQNSEERAKIREAKNKLNEIARANWDNPTWRREMAAEITEEIYWGFEHENLLSLLTEVENTGFNDRVFVKETRGLRAHFLARGGQIEASTLHSEVTEMQRDTLGFHVFEFEDKILTNFSETQATIIELGMQRLDSEVNKRFLALLQAAVPSSSANYITASGLSLTSLNTALREVRDETFSFDVSIIGRHTMVDQVMDELLGASGAGSNYLPETNENLVQRGVLGQYRGAKLISINNFKDDVDVPFFPANELYVVGRDASKFAFWGGLMSKEYVEADAWYWHYIVRRDVGGMVHRPNRIRRIIDSSITP